MPPSRGGILKGSAALVLLCAFAFIFTSYHVVHRSSSTLRTTLVAASDAPSYARNGGNNTQQLQCGTPSAAFQQLLQQHALQGVPWAPKIFVYWKEFNEAPALQAFDVRTCKDARWYDVEITLATELADCYETKNPNEADFFLIAHRGTCLAHAWLRTNYSVPIGWYFNNVSEGYMLPMLEKIRTRYPYFNRTSGRDHIIIGSHDEGIAQFGPALRRRLQRTIRLQLVGLDNPAWVAQTNDAIDRAKFDIVVPTRNVDEADPSLQCEKNGNACFFGTVHKNVQYSHGVRQSLKAVGEAAYPGLVVNGHVATYAASMCACKFALCPSGYLPWSPRLVDAIILGTVPVIIADNIRVPFHRWIDYTKFSVKAHDATVRDSPRPFLDALLAMPREVYNAKLQETQRIAPLFSYKQDAVFMIGLELWWSKHKLRHGEDAHLPTHLSSIGHSQYW